VSTTSPQYYEARASTPRPSGEIGALDGYAKALGADYPDTLTSVYNLYHQQERYDAAAELYERTCDVPNDGDSEGPSRRPRSSSAPSPGGTEREPSPPADQDGKPVRQDSMRIHRKKLSKSNAVQMEGNEYLDERASSNNLEVPIRVTVDGEGRDTDGDGAFRPISLRNDEAEE